MATLTQVARNAKFRYILLRIHFKTLFTNNWVMIRQGFSINNRNVWFSKLRTITVSRRESVLSETLVGVLINRSNPIALMLFDQRLVSSIFLVQFV